MKFSGNNTLTLRKYKLIKIMNILNENFVISILLSLSVSLSHCVPLAWPSSGVAFPPPSISFEDKRPLSFSDLERSYATLSRTAVTRDAVFSDVINEKNQFRSTNNGQDFNMPIDHQSLRNDPIGTYQYTDSNGDLHIVNYINDYSGLKILNDYKPFESIKNKKSFENTQSADLKNNGMNKFHSDASMPTYNAEDNSDDVDWDEVEFTFIPQSTNATKNTKYQNSNNSDLNSEESHKNVEAIRKSQNNMTQLLTDVMNSIPLPPPFSGPNAGDVPFFLQRPTQHDNNWRGPPIAQSILYGIPLKDSAANLGPQPFPHFFDWNYDMKNRQ